MPAKSTKHILVIRFSAMGDVAMTVPVILAVVQQHPNVKVTVTSREQYKPFFDGIPGVNFLYADFNKEHKGILGLWKLYRHLRSLHIYAVADLHNVLRSKIITRLFALRGKKTATTDKMRDRRKLLTAAKDKVFEPLPAVTQRHADVFAQLGLPVSLEGNLFLSKQQLTDDITGITGLKTGTWIGIAPFAQHKSKVYPKDLMQQVINTLAQDTGTTLLLFGGGKREIHLLKNYAGDKPNVIVIAGGKMILKQELKLISNLDLMLSMDSANAHMAALFNIKTITLWGATHPYAGFTPFKQPLEHALVSDREQYPMLPTSVYGNKAVPGYEDAMRTITPNAVVAKINEVLGR